MARQKQKRPRTYARNRAAVISRSGNEKIFESDGTYLLKLVAFVLLGTLWLKFSQPIVWIWYAILIVVTIICYFVPAGIVI